MAAALLAALFAMGVFSASGVGADEHSITLSASTAEPNDVITVTGTGFGAATTVSIYLAAADAADDASLGAAVAADIPASGGSFTGSFRIVDATEAGNYKVHAATAGSPTVSNSLANKPLTVEVNAKIRSVVPMKINKALTSNAVTVTAFGFSATAGEITITVEDSMGEAVTIGGTTTNAQSAGVLSFPITIAATADPAPGMATVTAKQGTGANAVERTAMLEIVAPTIELQIGGSALMNTDNAVARVIAVKGTNFADGDLVISAQPVNADDSLGDKIDLNGPLTGASPDPGAGTDVTVTRTDPATITAFLTANGMITIPQGTAASKIRVTAMATADAGTADGTYTATADFMLDPAAPGQVMNVLVQGGQGVLLATWTQVAAMSAPELRPESTGYQVAWQEIGASTWMSKDIADASIVSTEISGLDHTKNYLVRVRAKAAGTDYGAWSSTVLGSPTGPAAVTPAAMLSLSHAPDDDMLFDVGATRTQSRTVSGMVNGAAAMNLEFVPGSNDTDVVTVSARNITNADGDVTGSTVTVTPVGPGTATITVTATSSDGSMSDMTSWDVTVLGVVSSTNKADADVVLEIFASAAAEVRGGRDIVVGLAGYFIPDGGIDENDVLVDGHTAGSYYGNPADVTVSGSNVIITIPTKVVGAGGQSVDTQINPGNYTIRFKDGADLRNPNSAGNKTITVGDSDPTAQEMPVAIVSHISVKPGWVMRGDAFTVTGKGINSIGDGTVHLYTGTVAPDDLTNLELVESSRSLVLGRSARDGGTVTVEGIDTTHSSFVADAINATADADAKGYNLIVMVDAGGNVTGYTRLGILPTVTLDVTDVRRTGRVEVSVSDWYYGRISDAYINGIQVNLPDNTHTPHDNDTAPDDWGRYSVSINNDKTATFTVVVDRDVRLGEMEVRLVGTTRVKQGTYSSTDAHKQTVNVGFFDLTLTPSTAVTDQVIRIEGTGFGANICIASITVGEEYITEATTGDRIIVGSNTSNCVLTDSDGDVANSFKVPYNLKPDDYKVVVRDANNRVGEATLTVPEPTITLSPAASQRGSTVTVIGENFPAQDVIGITYGGDTVTVATTDTIGKWRATFKVPVDATIGREYEVVAQSDKKGDGQQTGPTTPPKRANLNAKATHTVPEETLKVWPRGQAEPPDDTEEVSAIAYGGRLQVKATNLPPHTKVSLYIGDIPVAGRVLGEDAAADSAGRYSDSVLVPQLTPGTHTVQLDVHTIGTDVVVVTFVDILDTVTRPVEDVFEDLVENGQLVSVWRYNIDETGSDWDSYSPEFADVEGVNDLVLVTTDDIVWIRVNANATFQGAQLFAGWNLVTLE